MNGMMKEILELLRLRVNLNLLSAISVGQKADATIKSACPKYHPVIAQQCCDLGTQRASITI
jgi:hypothetical protein